MKLAYIIGIRTYTILLYLISPFHKKAKMMINGRKQVLPKEVEKGAIWFHCASLGEFEQARPVIEKVKSNYPDKKILLTFFSPSGYEIRKNYGGANYIYYLPFDSKKNAKNFILKFEPCVALFVKYEFWYFHYKQLVEIGTPVISFSTILRSTQIFFKPWGGFNRGILHLIDSFFVQNNQTKDLLSSIGIEKNVFLAGDTRFDRVHDLAQNPNQIEIIKNFKEDKKMLVIGSSWNSDMKVILPTLQKLESEIKIIIAPHEINEREIEHLQFSFSKCVRYTETTSTKNIESNVLILDTIGLLSSAYNFGEFAYIGGAFGSGLHNTLEPCAYGCAIIFGPEYSKFQEAIDLVNNKGAFSISNTNQFEDILQQLLSNTQLVENIKEKNINYIHNNIGATNKIFSKLDDLL